MKITVRQLKQLIKEQVEEAGRKEAPALKTPKANKIPVATNGKTQMWAQKNEDGSVVFWVKSSAGDHDLMSKEEMIDWFTSQVEDVEENYESYCPQ